MRKPYYLILDTETNGFLVKKETCVSPYSGRILQLAWAVYDSIGRELKRQSFYIQPVNYSLRLTEIHGITEQTLYQSVPFMVAFKLFLDDMKCVKAILGHNILFDESILVNELNMCGQMDLIDLFDNVAWVCTCKLSKKLYENGRHSLGDIYQGIFNKPIEGAHNAINDVLALGEIVTYWFQTKMIIRSFIPYPKNGFSYLIQKKIKVEPEVETEVEPKVKPEVEPKVEPKLEKIKIKINLKHQLK